MKSYFRFMEAVWSCNPATLEMLLNKAEQEGIVPDLSSIKDVRQIKRAPSGIYPIRLASDHTRRKD